MPQKRVGPAYLYECHYCIDFPNPDNPPKQTEFTTIASWARHLETTHDITWRCYAPGCSYKGLTWSALAAHRKRSSHGDNEADPSLWIDPGDTEEGTSELTMPDSEWEVVEREEGTMNQAGMASQGDDEIVQGLAEGFDREENYSQEHEEAEDADYQPVDLEYAQPAEKPDQTGQFSQMGSSSARPIRIRSKPSQFTSQKRLPAPTHKKRNSVPTPKAQASVGNPPTGRRTKVNLQPPRPPPLKLKAPTAGSTNKTTIKPLKPKPTSVPRPRLKRIKPEPISSDNDDEVQFLASRPLAFKTFIKQEPQTPSANRRGATMETLESMGGTNMTGSTAVEREEEQLEIDEMEILARKAEVQALELRLAIKKRKMILG